MRHSVSSVLRWASFPVLLVAPTAAIILLVRADWPRALGIAPGLVDLMLYFIVLTPAVLAIAALERIIPYRDEWNRPLGDVPTDLAHWVTSYSVQSANRIALLGAATLLAGRIPGWAGGRVWPSEAPLVVQLVLALLIADLGHYAFHRFTHEHPLGWRLHATHHSAERLYWMNANRFQWLDITLLQACSIFPLLVLGMPQETFVVYGTYVVLFGHLQHANVDFRTGWLSYLLSTPDLHRYHHSTDPREGNKNYTGDLVIWDLVFGSFHFPKGERFRGTPGLAGLPRFPKTFLAQQLSPFRWRRVEGAPIDEARILTN